MKFLLSVAVALTSRALAAPTDAPIVTTKYGQIEGSVVEGGVKRFIGIPFAKPPTRFAPPEPADPWNTTLKATAGKPSCIQQFNYPQQARDLLIKIFSDPLPEESEDCLYTNVYVPPGPVPTSGWPVMFWIYGGDLQFGHALLPQYDGTKFALNQNVVIVAANYRTNVFGFPNSPVLEKNKSNLGFLDQRLALDWTHKNIEAFGGNRDKITIFGESAGGFSVKQLVSNPPEPVPFRAAIMESQASSPKKGPESWTNLTVALKCNVPNSIDCVRKVPATEIKRIVETTGLSFGPVEDNETYTFDTRKNIEAGTAAKVPIIIGTNKDEGTPFIAIGFAVPNATLADIFGKLTGGSASTAKATIAVLRALYPGSAYNTDFKLGSAVFTDLGFVCGASLLTDSLATHGYNVHRYWYSASFYQQWKFQDAGAFHSAEIDAVFGTYDPKIDGIQRVSKVVQKTWGDFAKSPNAAIADWPKIPSSSFSLSKLKEFGSAQDQIINGISVDSRCEVIGSLVASQSGV